MTQVNRGKYIPCCCCGRFHNITSAV